MGDVNSKPASYILCKAKYSFPYGYCRNGIDWSYKNVYIINSQERAQEAAEFLNRFQTLYVGCKGHSFGTVNVTIGIIQLAVSKDVCFLFDVVTCSDGFRVIKQLLETDKICKVFHDCSENAAALQVVRFAEINGIYVRNLFDTQVAQETIERGQGNYVNKVYSPRELYELLVHKTCPKFDIKSLEAYRWLHKRPISEDMVKDAVSDVMVLPEIYENQMSLMSAEERIASVEEVKQKVEYKRKWIIAVSGLNAIRDLLNTAVPVQNNTNSVVHPVQRRTMQQLDSKQMIVLGGFSFLCMYLIFPQPIFAVVFLLFLLLILLCIFVRLNAYLESISKIN